MTSSAPADSRTSPLISCALLGALVIAGSGAGAQLSGGASDRAGDLARARASATGQPDRVVSGGGVNRFGIVVGDRYRAHGDSAQVGQAPSKVDADLARGVAASGAEQVRWTEADVTVAVPVEGGVALATTPLTPPTGHFPWWAGALIWLFGIGVAAALGRNPVAGLLAIGAGAAVLGPPLAALAAGGAALLVLRPTSRIVGHARHDAAPYLYALPAVLGLAVLIMIPFVVGVGMAFFRHRHGEWSFVGLSHFAEILAAGASGDTRFWWTLFVTFLWTAVNVVLHVSIGLSLALLLKDGVGRLTPVYRVLLVLPWAIPNYITALTWKGMFNKEFGAVNAALALVGAGPVDWLGSTFLPAFTANVITNTWLGFPFMMVVSLGALQSIPAELYEAAEVDGASRWTRFRTITLPLLKPALFPAVILGSIWTFNMFNVIYLVSGGGPNGETDILITEAYRAFRVLGRYGYAASYSTMIFLILLGYTLITNRVTKATEGAFD